MTPLYKICKVCKISKSYSDDYYKNTGGYAQPECKVCMCKTDRRRQYKYTKSLIKYPPKPYVKKPKKLYGFYKLDIDKQNLIKQMITEKKTLKSISELFNISYSVIKKWSYTGCFKQVIANIDNVD